MKLEMNRITVVRNKSVIIMLHGF